MRKCPRCKGDGYIVKMRGIFTFYREFCHYCKGKGRIPNPRHRKLRPRFRYYLKRYQRRKL